MEDNKIVYDFNLSKNAVQELEDEYVYIKMNVVDSFEDELRTLSSYWQSESTGKFIDKCDVILDNLKRINSNILLQAEQIKLISRHIYLTEEQNKEIIASDDVILFLF